MYNLNEKISGNREKRQTHSLFVLFRFRKKISLQNRIFNNIVRDSRAVVSILARDGR